MIIDCRLYKKFNTKEIKEFLYINYKLNISTEEINSILRCEFRTSDIVEYLIKNNFLPLNILSFIKINEMHILFNEFTINDLLKKKYDISIYSIENIVFKCCYIIIINYITYLK